MKYTRIEGDHTLYHHSSGDHIADTIHKSKNYFDYEYLSLIKEVIISEFGSQKLNILEVGANIGNHVSFYLNNLNVESIVAVEPLAENLEILRMNVNGDDRVKILPFGVGVKNELLEFYINPRNYGASSLERDYKRPDSKLAQVEVREWNLVDSDNYNFIKIDIEGGEEYILEDISNTIIKCGAIVAIEINPWSYKNKNDIFDFFRKLFDAGYYLKRIRESDYLLCKDEAIHGDMKKITRNINAAILRNSIWSIRDKYDSEPNRRKLKELSRKYRKLIKGHRPQLTDRLIWSKMYRFFKR